MGCRGLALWLAHTSCCFLWGAGPREVAPVFTRGPGARPIERPLVGAGMWGAWSLKGAQEEPLALGLARAISVGDLLMGEFLGSGAGKFPE